MDLAHPPKTLAATSIGLPTSKLVKILPLEHIDSDDQPLPGRPENAARSLSSPVVTTTRPVSTPARSSRSVSPAKEARWTKLMPTPEDANRNDNRNRRGGLNINSWFQGSSAPVTLGLGSINDTAAENKAPVAIELDKLPGRRSSVETGFTMPSPIKALSFFGIRGSRDQPPSPTKTPEDYFDGVLSSSSSIFEPYLAGTPDTKSIEDIKAGIDALHSRLRKMYHVQRAALNMHVSDCELLQDGRDEAQNRAELLKTQLGAMATRLAEQEKANEDLAQELARERRSRVDEGEARRRSILLVKKTTMNVLEDDAVDGRGTSKAAVEADPGYYSEAESSATDSTFFESQAATISQSSIDVSEGSISATSDKRHCDSINSWPRDTFGASPKTAAVATRPIPSPAARPRFMPRLSTFQKVLKEITTTTVTVTGDGSDRSPSPSRIDKNDRYPSNSPSSLGDANDASVRPDTESLRTENLQLKERVADLEKTVEGCLALVGGGT